jgi:RNA polymerase sigma-70 factor (ECF subfamily)
MAYSLEEIYTSYWEKVYRLCKAYAGEEGKDLAQETFLIVFEKLHAFRGESNIGTWIFRIATNVCLQKGRVRFTSLIDEIPEEIAEDQRDQVDLLYRFIGELKELDRLIISLELEEMPQAEIARITGMSEGNIRVRIHRIKETLSKKFQKHGYQ